MGPYKKQKKETPLSEEALKRFDKELPQRRTDWYTPRSAEEAPAEEQVPDEEGEPEAPTVEETSVPAIASPDDFESNVGGESLVGTLDREGNAGGADDDRAEPVDDIVPSLRKNTRMQPSEVPARLRFSDGAESEGDSEMRKSSPKMAEIRAKALEEAKMKQETAAGSAQGG